MSNFAVILQFWLLIASLMQKMQSIVKLCLRLLKAKQINYEIAPQLRFFKFFIVRKRSQTTL